MALINTSSMKFPDQLLDEDLIFHFTKSRIAIENILHEGRFRFSPLAEMNDPYEYKIASSGIISWGSIDQEKAPEIDNLLRKSILKHSKIACFVQAKNDCNVSEYPFVKPRFWAQYGDEQYGVCLAFRKSKLLRVINKEICDIKIYEDSITYDLDIGPSSKKAALFHDRNKSDQDNIFRHLAENNKDIYFRKYADFSGENEYRIVLVDKSENGRSNLFCSIGSSLVGVVVGDRFKDVYLGLIKELCIKYKAELYALRYGNSPYIFSV